MSADYVIPAAPQAVVAVAGTSKTFPVRRIWCVGRNYIEHIREMGQDAIFRAGQGLPAREQCCQSVIHY